MEDLSGWLRCFAVIVEGLKGKLSQLLVLPKRAYGKAAEPVFQQVGKDLLGELFDFRFRVARRLKEWKKEPILIRDKSPRI